MTPPRDGNRDLRSDELPTVSESEALIAKDAPALKARVEKTDWPDGDKRTFLDTLLGKGKK